MNFKRQLATIKALPQGWLDGQGEAFDPNDLKWVEQWWETYIHPVFRLSWIYPEIQGSIRAEWMVGQNYLSLEIDPRSRVARLHNLHMKTDAFMEQGYCLESVPESHALVCTLCSIQESASQGDTYGSD